KRLYKWLVNHKIFGKYIYYYSKYKKVPLKAKISAILLIWVSIVITIILVNKIIVYITLPIIALLVTTYILSLQTLKTEKNIS
ncbi:MAG TPA: DUF454 domain-containing protein, partial [Acholeplasmataceae bacterium]|nr:DUF454 domain-containing protein [Acholeplasmataceae bacterium]